MHMVRFLFFAEAAVNAVAGPLMIISPELVLGEMLGTPMEASTAEACRWFGCMTVAFGCVLLGNALRSENAAVLSHALIALLVGDLTYTPTVARWVWSQQNYTPAAAFAVLFSLVLLIVRIAALRDIRLAMPPPRSRP